MRRFAILSVCLIGCLSTTSRLQAEILSSGLIPVTVAEKYGLERAWFSQLRIAPGQGQMVNMRLQVSNRKALTTFQVTTDRGLTYNISERQLNAFGEPMGVEGAEKAAAEKARLLRLEGITPTIERKVVPEITLYATTDSGVVHAFDAETGSLHWATAVGQSDYPTSLPAVNDDYVAIINGQTLYILHPEDGAVIAQRRVIGAPAAGPAIVGTRVYVPLLNGQLKVYGFGKDADAWPETYRANGSIEFPPTAAGDIVVWPTDTGTISALFDGRLGIIYRLRLGAPIAGPVMFSPPNQLLAVTNTGYLYSFDVQTAQLQWRFSSGDEAAEPAAFVGDTVYLITRRAGIHAVSAVTGERKWWAPFARQFGAATKDRVYTTTTTGEIVVLDVHTGSIISQIPMNPTDRLFVNNQTDRLYIGAQSGVIQCLHEIGAEWPVIHAPAAEAGAPAEPQPEAQEGAAGEAKSTDPFATEPAKDADPFKSDAGAKPEPKKTEVDDPFK